MAAKERNPLETLNAIKKMMDTLGWKIFQERVAAIGDKHMTELVNTDLPAGKGFTKRDLRAHQCAVVKEICSIPSDIQEEANAYTAAQKGNNG